MYVKVFPYNTLWKQPILLRPKNKEYSSRNIDGIKMLLNPLDKSRKPG